MPQLISNSTRLAALGRVSFDFFHRVIRSFTEPKPSSVVLSPQNHSSFINEYQRFKIWAVDLGLLVPGHGSLDYRLRDAENLGDTFELYLADLNQYLEETLIFSNQDKNLPPALSQIEDELQEDYNGDPMSGDEDGEEKEPQWYIDILLASIIDVIDRLYKLSTLIRNTSTRLISSKAKLYRNVDHDSGVDLIEAFGHHDHDFVLSVFRHYQLQVPEDIRVQDLSLFKSTLPQTELWHREAHCAFCKARNAATIEPNSHASEETQNGQRWVEAEEGLRFLMHRIAQANNRRRQRLAYWKEHRGKLETHTAMALDQKRPIPMPPDIVVPKAHDAKELGRDRTGLALLDLLVPPSVTTATALLPNLVVPVDDKSVISVSEYAASDWDPGREISQFPQPPKRPPNEKFFECPYCYTICRKEMLSEKAWKAHLIHDLRPYICTYPDCNTGDQLYDSRREWIEHENTFHRRKWRCPEHSDSLHASVGEYLQHVRAEHEEDSSLMCSETYLRSCESVSPLADRPCPVCFFSPTDMQTLQSHLARHLERFSLFALPRSTEEDKIIDENEADSVAAIHAARSSREMDSGMSSNSADGWRNALLEASRSGNLAVMKHMLAESDFDQTSHLRDHYEAALIEAATNGHIDVVDILLDAGALVDGVVSGRTALIAAASKGDVKIVAKLCENGADVNLSSAGDTPLMAAVSAGHLSIVKYLLQAGADANAVLEHRTALIEASTANNVPILQMLLQAGADPSAVAEHHTALMAASSHGHSDIVRRLIEAGADVNAEAEGSTALSTASNDGAGSMVELLCEYGADINQIPLAGSALKWAAHRGNEDLVRFLLKSGASVNVGQEESALQAAVRQGRETIVDILIARGADVNWRNGDLASILTSASGLGYEKIVQKLLTAGADANSRGENWTALRAAAEAGYNEIVKMLLEAGADPNATHAGNETALHFACEAGHEDVVATLIQAGANMDISSRRSGTALQLADKFGRKNIVERLLAAGANADLAGDHMDNLIRFGTISKSRKATAPTLPRPWELETHSDEAEGLELVLVHDIALTSVATCVSFSRDGRHLAVGGRWSAWIYDLDDLAEVSELRHISEHDSDLHVRTACFSWDGRLVLTGGEDGRVCLWEMETKTLRDAFEDSIDHHETDIYAVAFSPDATMFASASAEGLIVLYDYDTGSVLHMLTCDDSITSLSFTPDSTHLAYGDLTGDVYLLKCHDWGFYKFGGVEGHHDSVLSVAFSSNGEQLFSASLDRTVKCWRLLTTRLDIDSVRTHFGHEDGVLSVAETGDSRWIVSGSKDKTVRLWDSATGEPQALLKGYMNSVICVATCPTRKLFATASGDMTFTVWGYD